MTNPEFSEPEHLRRAFDVLPEPPGPKERSGVGYKELGVIGLDSKTRVTTDMLVEELVARGRRGDKDCDPLAPGLSAETVQADIAFLSTIEDVLRARGLREDRIRTTDLNGRECLVVPLHGGTAGKLVYFVAPTSRGGSVLADINRFTDPSRLAVERTQAFLKQLSVDHPTHLRNIPLEVDIDDIDWPMLKAELTSLWTISKLSTEQFDACIKFLELLESIQDGTKAYIAGLDRQVDLYDFIVQDPKTNKYFLNFSFIEPRFTRPGGGDE